MQRTYNMQKRARSSILRPSPRRRRIVRPLPTVSDPTVPLNKNNLLVMRAAHASGVRLWGYARAYVAVGDELSEGIHATAQAISALVRHGQAYALAKAEGKPVLEPPPVPAEKRAA